MSKLVVEKFLGRDESGGDLHSDLRRGRRDFQLSIERREKWNPSRSEPLGEDGLLWNDETDGDRIIDEPPPGRNLLSDTADLVLVCRELGMIGDISDWLSEENVPVKVFEIGRTIVERIEMESRLGDLTVLSLGAGLLSRLRSLPFCKARVFLSVKREGEDTLCRLSAGDVGAGDNRLAMLDVLEGSSE